MAWYDSAVFYHIYPLGLCGCSQENTGVAEQHFDKLKEWAEHAVQIGCNALYIGPLFESVGHGYETTDYKKVDIRLGTNQDFKEFVTFCHQMDMKVIVDGVFNHVGRRFFAFEDLQKNRERSPYRDWFCNVNFGGNNEYNDGFCYENWGGYNLLVKLNQRNPAVKEYLFDVIRFWVKEFDIDGIRLDAADVLDFDFMKQMRHETDQMKEDFWLMGEVIHGDYSRWVNQETLHAVTNYELHKGLYSGHNDHNYFEIAHTIRRLNDLCQGAKLYTFVDNHDVERIYSKLNNKEHLSLVTMLLYTLYGIPSVYYGSEFGIEGKKEKGSDWNLRPCLELKDYQDAITRNPVTKLSAQLGRLKQKYRELTDGRYQELHLMNRQFAFGRVLDGSAMITALNCDDGSAVLEFNAPVSAAEASDLLGNAEQVEYQEGRLRVTLPANTGTVILLSDQKAPAEEVSVQKGTAGSTSGTDSQGTAAAMTDSESRDAVSVASETEKQESPASAEESVPKMAEESLKTEESEEVTVQNGKKMEVPMKRRDKTNYYLDLADVVSKRCTCLRRHYGAVIVKNDEVISTGYVGAPRGRKNCSDLGQCIRQKLEIPRGERYELCRSVHAEANAIISAEREKMIGSTLYLSGREVSTGEYVSNSNSCSMCKKMIINAGIERVIIRDTEDEYRTIQVQDWVEHDDSLEGTLGY